MFTKIQSCIESVNLEYMANFTASKETLLCDVRKILDYLQEKIEKEKIEFVHGTGKRKLKNQKFKEEPDCFYER